MLPASNRGVGGNLCFPDVCLTPPVGAPVPYVNLGMNATAAPFAIKTYLSCVNALNMGSIIPLTNGDQSGAMSPFMGMGMTSLGNPKIFTECLPAVNLACPATGNNMIAALGAVLIPSVTNVFYTYARAASAAEMDADMLAGIARELSVTAGPAAESAHEELLPGDAVYLSVPVFSLGLPSRVYDALRRLAPGGARALVLDLRGCPGGELAAAIELAGDFLPEGAVIAVVTDEQGDDIVYSSRREPPYTMPVLLLVDRHTASAAEVFAGSLQAHGRAVVAGERTYGKGAAQQVLPGAAAPGAHYATVATVTLPGGNAIQGTGIQPDVVV
jgi:carboxyl-terminal processing protease